MTKISQYLNKGIILVSAVFLIGPAVQIHSQSNENGLTISPAIMELNADRGGVYEFTMKLENDTSQQVYTLYPYVQTFTAEGDSGTPTLRTLNEDDPINNWVQFNEDVYSLAPGEETNARFRVVIPEESEAGSYYLAISYTTNNEASEDSNVVIDQEVSALLFITVKGEITRSADFVSFETGPSIVDPFLDDFLISYKIKSDGNAYLKPLGNIFVGTDSENPDQSLPLNPNENIILPGTQRSFYQLTESDVKIPLLSNKVNINSLASQPVESELDLPIMKYESFEATMVFVNSEGVLEQKTVTKNVIFFPYKTILLTLILSLSVYGMYRWSRSHFGKPKPTATSKKTK